MCLCQSLALSGKANSFVVLDPSPLNLFHEPDFHRLYPGFGPENGLAADGALQWRIESLQRR
jgi:hypothetical protein